MEVRGLTVALVDVCAEGFQSVGQERRTRGRCMACEDGQPCGCA